MGKVFELFQGEADGKWYFRLKARNGEIIAQSEGYETIAGAKLGVAAVKKSVDAKVVVL